MPTHAWLRLRARSRKHLVIDGIIFLLIAFLLAFALPYVLPVGLAILGAILAAIAAPFIAISALFDERRERREKETEEHRRDKDMEEAHRAVGDPDQVLLPWQVLRLQAEEEQRRFEEEQPQFAARVAERAEEARRARSEVGNS